MEQAEQVESMFGSDDEAMKGDVHEPQLEHEHGPGVSIRRTCPSLRELSLHTLISVRGHLRDIGFIDPDSVRDILSHCNKQQLKVVEDCTLAGSGRDLSWYTWHMWHRHYTEMFGFTSAANANLPPLPGQRPCDYVSPKLDALAGHWRQSLENKIQADKERAERVSIKMRGSYAKEDMKREAKKATVYVAPQTKRRRVVSNGGVQKRPSADLPKGKALMLHGIGLISGKALQASTKNAGNTAPTPSGNFTRGLIKPSGQSSHAMPFVPRLPAARRPDWDTNGKPPARAPGGAGSSKAGGGGTGGLSSQGRSQPSAARGLSNSNPVKAGITAAAGASASAKRTGPPSGTTSRAGGSSKQGGATALVKTKPAASSATFSISNLVSDGVATSSRQGISNAWVKQDTAGDRGHGIGLTQQEEMRRRQLKIQQRQREKEQSGGGGHDGAEKGSQSVQLKRQSAPPPIQGMVSFDDEFGDLPPAPRGGSKRPTGAAGERRLPVNQEAQEGEPQQSRSRSGGVGKREVSREEKQKQARKGGERMENGAGGKRDGGLDNLSSINLSHLSALANHLGVSGVTTKVEEQHRSSGSQQRKDLQQQQQQQRDLSPAPPGMDASSISALAASLGITKTQLTQQCERELSAATMAPSPPIQLSQISALAAALGVAPSTGPGVPRATMQPSAATGFGRIGSFAGASKKATGGDKGSRPVKEERCVGSVEVPASEQTSEARKRLLEMVAAQSSGNDDKRIRLG
eukprot:gene11837-14941_t